MGVWVWPLHPYTHTPIHPYTLYVFREVLLVIVLLDKPLICVDEVAEQSRKDGGPTESDNSEVAIEICANRIVDPGQDLFDLEYLAVDLRRHDIAIGAPGNRDKDVAAF